MRGICNDHSGKITTDIYAETVTDATLIKADEFSFDLQRFAGYRRYYNGSWYEYYDNYCVSEYGGIHLLSSYHVYNFGDSDDYIIDNPDNVVTPWARIQQATINCGGGNDRLYTSASSQNLILGGAGDDSICVHNCDDVTVSGGRGNDTIDVVHSGNNVILYENGDGNDVITGEGFDKLILSGGTYCTTRNSAGDPVIQVGSGSITFKGWDGIPYSRIDGVYKESIPNSIISGSEGNDTLTNGDTTYVGDEIRNQREQALNNAEEILEELKTGFLKQFDDPVSQDIYENGVNSKYLQYLAVPERNALAEFCREYMNGVKLGLEFDGTMLFAVEKYGIDRVKLIQSLVKKSPKIIVNGNSGLVIKNLDKYPILRKVYKSETLSALKELNNRFVGKTLANTKDFTSKIGKTGTYTKFIKGFGTAIELFELGQAIYEVHNNPNQTTLEKVMFELIDVGASLIPIPFVDIATSALIKTGIVWLGHGSEMDFGATLMHHINIFSTSDATYVPKKRLMAVYINSSDDIVSFEELEQLYLNSGITIMKGDKSNDVLFNNGTDSVLMYGGEDDDVIKNYNSFNVVMYGGTGHDLLINLNSPNGTIYGGEGNDSIINNYSANVLINTGDGDNFVSVYDSNNVKIMTGDGDNTIDNVGKHVSIRTGSGSDSIFNIGAFVSINSGEGDDSIESVGDMVTINAGEGDNYIHAEGNSVFLTAGGGSNVIDTNEFSDGFIQTGDSADDILNLGSNNTIYAGGGSNTVNNIGDHNMVSTGDDEDYIENIGDYNTIDTGAGDDLIELIGHSNFVESGAGDDLVIVYEGNNNTISSGTGDDFIYLDEDSTALVKYTSGNDTISGFNANDTLQLSYYSGSYSTQISGDDVIVNVNAGQIVLLGVASLNTINITLASEIHNEQSNVVLTGTNYAASIYNSGKYVTINTGEGNDSIYNDGSYFGHYDGGDSVKFDTGDGDDYIYNNNGDNPTINTGDGNDSVYNHYGIYASIDIGNGNDSVYNLGHDSTINGGDGDDTINNRVQKVSINAGDGNNYISNEGSKTTIFTGKGNDNIFNSGSNATINAGAGDDSISIHSGADNNLILYNPDDGNDYIVGFNETSTLRIGDGTETYSSIKSGDNILVMVDKNKITLKGAASLSVVNIEGEQTPVVVNLLDIIGTNADDNIDNSLDGATIQALGGNDTIYNTSHYTTINAGDGNDKISNTGSNTSIFGSDGDDRIENNQGQNVTINGGTGNDYIGNSWGTKVNIDSGEGDDYVFNYANDNTINANDGKDTIYNVGSNVIIDGGAGDDYIDNYLGDSNVTIDAGDDNDTISNTGSYASILGGYGNDSIYNENGINSSVSGGAGNDTIYNTTIGMVYIYSVGDGNDLITGFNEYDTLFVASGTWTSAISDSDIIVTVGDGEITLQGAATAKNINVTFSVSDINPINSISNRIPNTLLTGTESLDSIFNSSASNVTIRGLGGDDEIENYGSSSILDGGDGDDSIYNSGSNSSIVAGAGNDSIYNYGSNVFITSGTGNDSIYNQEHGTSVTLDGGVGDDTIRNNNAENLLLTYTEGDGNDCVTGFNTTSTLRIGGGSGSYSSQNSGSDIIVTVGEGSIILKGAATLSTVNIQGEEEVIEPTWTLNGTTATYGTNSETLLTITGVKSLSGISLNNKIVTVSNVALNQGTVTVSDGYTLKLANDVTIPTKTKAGWSPISSSKATYNFESTTAGYTLTDNKINYTKATTAESFYLSGIKSTNGISVEGTTVTLNAANLDKKAVTISNGYKLALNNDVTASQTITAGWSNSNGSFIYTEAGTTEGYKLDANSVTYHTKTGGEQFTITGVKDTKNISVEDKVVTISNAALNGSTVFLTGKDYTLALAPDVPQSTTENPGSFTKLSSGTATFLTNSSGDFYILSDKKISYTPAVSGKSTTITGLKKTLTLQNGKIDGITSAYSNGVTIFKIKESALTNGDVTLSGDNCKLELDGYTKPAEVPATFVNGVYSQAYTPAFYSATDKKISYTAQVGGNKFTISGLKNDASIDNGIQISGKNVTLSQSVLNGENVTLTTSDGYKLAIDKSVPTYSTKIKATWSNVGDSYTYTAAGTSDYYKLGGNKLTYIKATGCEHFTITGVNSSSGIKVSGKNVTIGKAALGDKNVTFTTSDGYKLAFDKTVSASKEIKPTWTGKSGNFTYTAAGMTAGYSLNDNIIVYNEQIGGEQFTLTGVKDTKAVSVSGKVVTVGKASLNGKAVELTGDYILALGNDVPTSAAQVAGSFTTFAKGAATFKTNHYANDFYTLDGNKITYTPAGGNEIKISNLNTKTTLNDIKTAIDVSEQSDGSFKVTFKNADVLSTKAPAVSVPKGIRYTVAVDDKLTVAEQTPVWKVSGTNATFRTDAGATYTVSKNKVVYTKPKTGATQISLAGLVKNATLDLPQEKVLTLDASVFGKKTSLKSNGGGYSVKLTDNMSGKTFVGSGGADTLKIMANNASVDGGAGNDSITVTGDNVTILGGKGNDNITLNKAATLVYGSGHGNDTVNFVDGLVISESSEIKDATKNGSNLVFGFSKNSSLTITGVDDNDQLSVVNKKRNLTVDMRRFTLGNSLTFDKTKSPTAVTVANGFSGSISQSDDFYLGGAKLSNVKTFDASKVTGEISIEGNAKANTISGGQGQSKLTGGKGNDLFVFSGGELTITDYGNGADKINLNGYEIAKVTVDETSGDKSRDLTLSLKSKSKSGSLTVIDGAKNSKGKDVKISIVEGKKAPAYIFETDKIFDSGRTSVTVKGSDADFIGDTKLKFITADEDFRGSVILGNSAANIINGKSSANSLEGDKGNDIIHGGAGKDTLVGGKGNDKLWGNEGNDTFIYETGDGKDIIYGFEDGDLLQITGDFSAKFNKSKNEIAFKVGSTTNAITLKEFDATTFNINGDSYQISGTQLVKK